MTAVALTQRKPTASKSEHERSISGLVGLLIGGGGHSKPASPENEHERSMLRFMGCW